MSVVFFTDRDLGNQFPAILRSSGLTVERHADHFPDNCADEVWLRETTARGWIAVTHDARIRYKPNELSAVVAHGTRLLVVVGKASLAELANSFVNMADRINAFIDETPAPFIAKVYRASPAELEDNAAAAGRVALWYPRDC